MITYFFCFHTHTQMTNKQYHTIRTVAKINRKNEILLKVSLNTIILSLNQSYNWINNYMLQILCCLLFISIVPSSHILKYNNFMKEPEWKNGWTEDSSRQTCTEELSQMTALELCQTYAHIDISFYIESCIDDIKVTNICR